MTTAPSNKPAVFSNTTCDDELDLRQVAGAISRYRRLVAKITGASLILSCFYALLAKPVWEGQFQIVLADKESPASGANQLLQSNPGLANLIGIGSGENELDTEVKILESPSVLKPVFDYVKQKKEKAGNDVSSMRYSDWVAANLTIELAKGTSVLELAYRDKDKQMILPVIEQISKAYQSYSGRDREQSISLAIDYLNQQIEIYRAKSISSLRAAQQFAIEQDLTYLKGDRTNEAEIKNSINIEAIRVQAANEIRNINEQLKQLNQLDDNPETFIYLGRNITGLPNQEIPRNLDELDTELAQLRAKYTDQDESVRRLVEKRRLLIEVFKRQTYGYLYAQRTAAKARLAAAERPKGVLIKYRELLRTAARDEATLTRLEEERQVLSLEKARKRQPWELISRPTLLDQPVAPRNGRIIALGLFTGLVVGIGAALVVDRRTNLVYSEDELKSLLPCPLIKHLPGSGGREWSDAADLLAAGPFAKAPGNNAIALIPIGNIPNEQLQAFSTELIRALAGRELLVSTDLHQTSRCATQLLLTSYGAATRTQLLQLRQKLALQGTPLAGWVLLDSELNLA